MKKLSALMLLSATMILASCGKADESKPVDSTPADTTSQKGESTPTSEAGTSSQAPATSSQAPATSSSRPASSSQAPASSSQQAEAAVTYTGIDLVSESNKAYIKITGTMENVPAAQQKMAFGLTHKSVSSVDDGTAGWIVGSETPAAADYKYQPTVTGTTFELKVDVSAVTFAAGAYSVYAGIQGKYVDVTAALRGQSTSDPTASQFGGSKVKTTGFKLYFRDDVNALIADALPPVELTQALIELGTGDDAGKTFVLIGGELGETEAEFKAHTPFVQFQQVGGSWTNYRLDNQEGKVELVVRGTKGYVKADISSLPEGNFNTHLNVTANTQADCKMEAALDTKATPVVNGTKGYAVYCNPNASASDQSQFWGNLGIIINHAHQISRADAKAEGTDMWPIACPSNDYTGYEMDVDTTTSPGIGNDKKMNSGRAATFNITGIQAGEYEVYVKAHVTNGNQVATSTVGMSTGAQLTTNGASGGDPVPGRYYAQVGDTATAEKVYTDTGDKNFNAIGLDDATAFKWTNCPVIASLMVANGETSLTFKHSGAGYSLYVESIRLVRIGNWAPAAKNAVFTEGVAKFEAEDYSIKHTIFTSTGEETDYTTNGTQYPESLNGTVTDDATASGGKYVHAVFREGWNGTKRSNMSGELQYRVKLAADANVKIKAKIKSDMETEKVCFDLKVDGAAKGTLNAANEWVEVESAAMTLTAGVHTISFIGQQLGSSEGYRSVLADIDCWSFVEQAA